MNIREDENLSPFIRGKVHIIQKKEGYRFNLDSVLLADFIKMKKKKSKIIDLGTGSGILLILLSLRYKEPEFYAVEIQETLFDIAKRNFSLNKINVNIKLGDVKNIDKLFPPQFFDYVITNPPYYKIEGKKPKNKEVRLAKFEEKASVKDFVRAAFYLLKDNGSFFMINQSDRLSEILFLLKKNRLEPKRIRFVYPSVDEKSSHFLIEAVKNGKEGNIVEKPLIVYKKPREKVYTEKVNFLLEKFI